MLKHIFKPIANIYTGPIIVVVAMVSYLIFSYLPNESNKNNLEKLNAIALNMIEHVRDYRAYYTQNIVSKIAKHKDLSINYDHLTQESTIPLPATLLHDMSQIIPRDGMAMKMYSNYPFPNRADRVLDSYEKESIEYLEKNPYKIYAKIVNKDGGDIYRVSVADRLNQQACVNCHNSRADTPKNDWKLNDVRGVITVDIPYKKDFVLTSDQAQYLIMGLIFVLLAMGVHYSVVSFLKSQEHGRLQEYLKDEIEKKTYSLKQSALILEQYKNAVDQSAIVSKTDSRGVITYINDEFIKISGYSQEELLGKPHNIVRHPSMPSELFKELWDTIKSGKIWKGQIENRAKDGSSYYVATTIVPIVDAHGETQEYVAIRLNVTDIVEANLKAKAADRAKSTFLANMSHEIRTPLNGIIGFSEILSSSDKLDTQTKKYASIIGTSANSLLSIINDILDMSKIESGHSQIHKEPTNLSKTCEEVVELFSAKAHQKSIELIFNADILPHCLITDSGRVSQVLSNLLGNAIKFTPENGLITTSIKVINKSQESVKIGFSIKDTGIGIPKDKFHLLFEPFMQVDNEANRKYDGTGLGLFISFSIVSALGGVLDVKSEVGSGSEFFFELELDICDENFDEQHIDAAQNSIKKTTQKSFTAQKTHNSFIGKVLVAEDNIANQELIKYILNDLNIEFSIVSNGVEAVEAFKKERFDILFLDINMPIMDGVQACQNILEYEKQNTLVHTPIVALTANAIKGDRERFLALGMDSYLTKPLENSKLNAVLDLYLKKQKNSKNQEDNQETQTATIDSTEISKKLGVSEKVALLLIEKFEATIEKDLNELRVFIEQENKKQIRDKAHYIKGSSLTMGLESVSEILQVIETQDLSKEQLEQSYKSLEDELKKIKT